MSDQLELEVRKGKQAEQKLADPFFQEVLQRIKNEQVGKIVSSSVERPEIREHAYYLLKAVEALELELSKMVSNGIFANDKIQRGKK